VRLEAVCVAKGCGEEKMLGWWRKWGSSGWLSSFGTRRSSLISSESLGKKYME
jgi:hypothetical protein